MKHFSLISLALAGALSIMNAETYATVDGQKITEKDMDFFKQVIPGFNFDKLSKQDKEMAINQLVERRLALIAAKKDKIEKNKEYTETLNMIKNNLAIDIWVKQQQQKFASKVKVTEADVKNFYDNNKNFFIDQQAQVRQIVVKTQEEAKGVIAELKKKKGQDLLKLFIKLANEKSIDTGTQKSQNGGDLGTVNRNQMLPQFTTAVFGLKDGEVTDTPIQTEAGYHIIYLESKTEPKTTPYDQAKATIENSLRAQQIDQMIKEEMTKMRQKAKVVIEPIK